jgi:hypothetical protein
MNYSTGVQAVDCRAGTQRQSDLASAALLKDAADYMSKLIQYRNLMDARIANLYLRFG